MRLAAVAAVVLALAGCTSGSGGSDSGSSGGGIAVDGGKAPDGGVASGGGQPVVGEAPESADGRDVVVTGYLSMVADDPLRAADRARGVIEQAGGRLDGITKEPKSEYQDASSQLIARIPSERLDDTLDDVEALGSVQSLSTSANDVTQQTTDLDARITSLQSSVDRLRQLIGSATTTADLIAIETALSEREANLESLTAQRDYLADQVDYATMTIAFTTPAGAPDAPPTDFWGAVVAGFSALLSALGWTLIAIGAALPWLVFLALLGALALLIIRLVRRNRRPKPTIETPPAAS
ncbi:hypothetical protein GCM10025866_06610 [Naasia aerilata]|uniref:DUF4349 domain-containing protein n=1 Tax=Naasia aerilata TaxID=1162966 RepID=A0ABM8G985_9MICO|nr:hypothetical protein GCM10025866_06610 [Naasia aerilata]